MATSTQPRIMGIGRIISGEIIFVSAPEPTPAGFEVTPIQPISTRGLVDTGAEVEEYEDDLLDREFWARGDW
jgi:hypothetical protein